MRAFLVLLLCCCAAEAQIRVVAQPSRSPLVDFRVVFFTGAAYDPADKPGLAGLTAAQIAGGGTRGRRPSTRTRASHGSELVWRSSNPKSES